MAFISETLQMRRLTESGVNVKTTYIVDGTLRYRSTDGTCQDDVHSGIRCRKEYFRQGKLLHTEKIFDSRMEYTYVSGMDEEAQHTCENCGFTGKVKEFVNGCPCCDAASNIDYADKELGSKHHYDLVLQSPVYRIITGVVDYVVSFLLCSLWIINTSRTFNGYDVGKIFIYSTILSMILYYFFYLCDAYAVLGPVRRYKEKQNRPQQEYWHDMKFWWPQCEAIIATLYAYEATGDPKYLEMHKQINEYTYARFPDKEYGEWFGYFHYDGTLSQPAKGNMYKGPFHIPRMLLKCHLLCKEIQGYDKQ